MRKLTVLALIAPVAVIGIALVYGSARWKSNTTALHNRLNAARRPVTEERYSAAELASLPEPVQRYFRASLTEGQRIVSAAQVEHEGTFNMSETGEQWKAFTSSQRVVTQRPGFVWEGRIAMMPGVGVRVHDAYVAGEGILHASLFGLVSLANMRGTPEMAEGELYRFFAEAAWYPTALLPGQGVQWAPVDHSSARATLTDGDLSISMLFHFGADGLIESVRAEARGRTLGGQVIPTAWEGRWSNYELREGMRVPMQGEVLWLLPEGRKPYWRGRIVSITYEFAP